MRTIAMDGLAITVERVIAIHTSPDKPSGPETPYTLLRLSLPLPVDSNNGSAWFAVKLSDTNRRLLVKALEDAAEDAVLEDE